MRDNRADGTLVTAKYLPLSTERKRANGKHNRREQGEEVRWIPDMIEEAEETSEVLDQQDRYKGDQDCSERRQDPSQQITLKQRFPSATIVASCPQKEPHDEGPA